MHTTTLNLKQVYKLYLITCKLWKACLEFLSIAFHSYTTYLLFIMKAKRFRNHTHFIYKSTCEFLPYHQLLLETFYNFICLLENLWRQSICLPQYYKASLVATISCFYLLKNLVGINFIFSLIHQNQRLNGLKNTTFILCLSYQKQSSEVL